MAQLLRRQEEELAEQQRRIQAQREQIANAVTARLNDADHTPDPQVEHMIGPDANRAASRYRARTATPRRSRSASSGQASRSISAGRLATWTMDSMLVVVL